MCVCAIIGKMVLMQQVFSGDIFKAALFYRVYFYKIDIQHELHFSKKEKKNVSPMQILTKSLTFFFSWVFFLLNSYWCMITYLKWQGFQYLKVSYWIIFFLPVPNVFLDVLTAVCVKYTRSIDFINLCCRIFNLIVMHCSLNWDFVHVL